MGISLGPQNIALLFKSYLLKAQEMAINKSINKVKTGGQSFSTGKKYLMQIVTEVVLVSAITVLVAHRCFICCWMVKTQLETGQTTQQGTAIAFLVQ